MWFGSIIIKFAFSVCSFNNLVMLKGLAFGPVLIEKIKMLSFLSIKHYSIKMLFIYYNEQYVRTAET